MSLKWADVIDIAIEWSKARPHMDPGSGTVSVVNLRDWVWRWMILTIIRPVAMKQSSKPSRWHGLTNSIRMNHSFNTLPRGVNELKRRAL